VGVKEQQQKGMNKAPTHNNAIINAKQATENGNPIQSIDNEEIARGVGEEIEEGRGQRQQMMEDALN